MKAELFIIGDEVLDGKVQDLNANRFCTWAINLGLKVSKISMIPDREELMIEEWQAALKRSDLVITSGGIGPTKDDMTKPALAKMIGEKLQADPHAEEIVQSHYERIGKEWTPEYNSYHLFPASVEAIENPLGLAPGLFYQREGKIFVSLPGVPREFEAMLHQVLSPRLEHRLRNLAKTYTAQIKTVGKPEEEIFKSISPKLWEKLERFGQVASYPQQMGVDIVVRSTLPLDDWLPQLLGVIKDDPVASLVWQVGDLSVEELVFKYCLEKGKKIGFAESCTGGLASDKLTNFSGSSAVFMGSIVSYNNEVKRKVLGVSDRTLKNHGAVSEACAHEMAIGLKNLMNVDYAISFSGIAGPSGGTEQKPVGTLALGYATSKNSGSKIYQMRGDRLRLKTRFQKLGYFRILKLLREEFPDLRAL